MFQGPRVPGSWVPGPGSQVPKVPGSGSQGGRVLGLGCQSPRFPGSQMQVLILDYATNVLLIIDN